MHKIKLIYGIYFLFILLTNLFAISQELPKPIFSYLENGSPEKTEITGDYRILEMDGRKGVNPTSIHTRLKFPKHNLNEEKGSLTFWVFPLEELSAFKKRDVMFTRENLNTWTYSFLSDIKDIGDYNNSSFNLAFYTGWHPSVIAKFYKGDVFIDAITKPKKAYAMASAFEMHKNKWYQITLTWDILNKGINVYANGVLIATSDRYSFDFERSTTGDTLYAGKPLMCFGELKMYDKVFNQEQVEEIFEKESLSIDLELQSTLKKVHTGKDLEDFDWEPNEDWELECNLSLKNPKHLERFKIQGVVDDIKISNQGLRIKTQEIPYIPKHLSDQMYLWTKESFEGDIYVEYDFKTNQKFGLTLLVLQASGMAREDFMKDYMPRESGSMQWIHSSDMRNYHIEFYRVMNAVRNDNSNVAMIKNPYQYPMGYGTLTYDIEVGKWYKLQVLQRGNKFTFAIDGKIIFDALDKEFANNGPVLTYGRLAFRCMVNTDVTFRNLKVFNKKLPYIETKEN